MIFTKKAIQRLKYSYSMTAEFNRRALPPGGGLGVPPRARLPGGRAAVPALRRPHGPVAVGGRFAVQPC